LNARAATDGGSLLRDRAIAGKRFVDLTHSFGPDTPVWSGFGQARMTPVDPKTGEPYTIAKDGFRATYYQMVGQYGTHVDPPAHPAELRSSCPTIRGNSYWIALYRAVNS
jgi:kynurenine formamidase